MNRSSDGLNSSPTTAANTTAQNAPRRNLAAAAGPRTASRTRRAGGASDAVVTASPRSSRFGRQAQLLLEVGAEVEALWVHGQVGAGRAVVGRGLRGAPVDDPHVLLPGVVAGGE